MVHNGGEPCMHTWAKGFEYPGPNRNMAQWAHLESYQCYIVHRHISQSFSVDHKR